MYKLEGFQNPFNIHGMYNMFVFSISVVKFVPYCSRTSSFHTSSPPGVDIPGVGGVSGPYNCDS